MDLTIVDENCARAHSTHQLRPRHTLRDHMLQALREHIECDGCGKPNPPKTCSRCKLVHYCSANCQKSHWDAHKPDCQPIEAMRAKHLKSQLRCDAEPAEEADVKVDCSICLEEATRPVTVAGCKHVFCYACLRRHQEFTSVHLGMAAKCPLCRAELPDVDIGILERAQLFGSKAVATSTSDEARVRYCEEAQAELQKILDSNPSNQRASLLRAELLQVQGKHREGIEAIDAVLQRAEEFEVSIANFRQMEVRIRDAVEHEAQGGDVDEAQMGALEQEMQAMMESSSALKGRVSAIELNSINSKKGEMLEALGEWTEAFNVYKATITKITSPKEGTAAQQRMLMNACSRCLYHKGDYDNAITLGCGAIDANRYYPGCHDYVARAQLAKGDVQAAIRTRSRAVLFETPWDEENRAVQRTALAELHEQVAERRDVEEVQ